MAVELRDLLALREEVAAVDERNRMARELHDTVKQKMFAISLQLGAAGSLMAKNTAGALLRLNEAEKMTRMVQDDLNALLQELRSPHGMVCLAGTLNKLVEEWSWQTGINCAHFSVANEPVPSYIAAELIKVINEALTNTAKHSGASKITLKITTNGERLMIDFCDDGSGFEPILNNSSGMGLDNIRHRVQALPEGHLELASGPDGGARIIIECGGIHT